VTLRLTDTRRPARSAASLLALLVAMALGLAGGYVARPYFTSGPPKAVVTTERGETVVSRTITALGRLRPKGGVVPVYGPPGDRIGTWYDGVTVGASVTTKSPLVDLASKAERSTEFAVAEVQFREAEASVEKARAAADAKIAAAELEAANLAADEDADVRSLTLQIDVLAKQKELAAEQVRRLANLTTQRVSVSQDERDQAELMATKAEAEWEAAKIKRTKATDGYRRGRELATKKAAAARAERDEAIARAPLESARKKLELARQLLDLTTIKAPVDGTVLSVSAHVGEPTGPPQAILHVGDTRQMVVVAEVYESDVPALWEALDRNQTFDAKITTPALPGPMAGTVSSTGQLGRMIARNAIFALSPREDADRRVIEVLVDVKPEFVPLAARYVGLQVRVELTPAAGK
jgi:HlyD family secretion protein